MNQPDVSSPSARTNVLSKVIGYAELMPRPGWAGRDGTAVLSLHIATVEAFPNSAAPQVIVQYFEAEHEMVTLLLEPEDVARLMTALDEWKQAGSGRRREM